MEQVSEWTGTMLKVNIDTGKIEWDRREESYWKLNESNQVNR
jgi:hypothetical protein